MKKIAFGPIIGISSLILVPLLAQATSSASNASESSTRQRPTPSQACIQAQVAKQDLMLANMDATAAARRAAIQARRDALAAAATIVDDAARQAALKKANEDFRTAMKDLMQSPSAEMQAATDAVRTACGEGKGGKSGPKFGEGFGGGRMMGDFHSSRGMHRGWQQSSQSSSS